MATPRPLLLRMLATSYAASAKAGQIVRDILHSGDLGVVHKAENDVQTQADCSAQKCIIAALSKKYPKAKIIGEEGQSSITDVPEDWTNVVPHEAILAQQCPDELASVAEEDEQQRTSRKRNLPFCHYFPSMDSTAHPSMSASSQFNTRRSSNTSCYDSLEKQLCPSTYQCYRCSHASMLESKIKQYSIAKHRSCKIQEHSENVVDHAPPLLSTSFSTVEENQEFRKSVIAACTSQYKLCPPLPEGFKKLRCLKMKPLRDCQISGKCGKVITSVNNCIVDICFQNLEVNVPAVVEEYMKWDNVKTHLWLERKFIKKNYNSSSSNPDFLIGNLKTDFCIAPS